ncbi:hypothetical protein PENSPDRAFT_680956 [Peniophora sp. CONT]|nr:hypothetical protein PENSPDRAFT_680956 [Peniophora sp. CONT]
MFALSHGRATLTALLLIGAVFAQSPTSQAPSSTQQSSAAPSSTTASPSVTVFSTTSSSLSTSVSGTGNRAVVFSTFVADVINVTSTISPSVTSATSTTSATASASATPAPIVLDTKVDPAFGVLGALLILTGIPTAFLGHKNRWTSFFLIGWYTLSIVCLVLILRFGVLPAVNPPSATIRGMFVLACTVAGVVGGGLSIFFWKATKFFIGAWGGLAFGLWIQCFHNGGLIHKIAFRWIMYIGCSVVGFVLCTIPQIHYHVLLVSTAITGASSLMLGVDCYTTAGLKEFYVWNLGFNKLFPKFTQNGIQYPVSQTMQVELGLIGAIAVMGAAVQFRILGVLQRKLEEIKIEQRRRDALDEAKDAERFLKIEEEKQQWERQHPTLGKHARTQSDYSSMALMKDVDMPGTPDTESASAFGRARRPSGLSEFMSTPTPTDDDVRTRSQQGFGALPALDLGNDVESDIPKAFIAEDAKNMTPAELEDYRRKQELLAEIEGIRSSIDKLKAETPTESRSRQVSMTSRRTLSYDFDTAILPEAAHPRPLHSVDPRLRASSMGAGSRLSSPGLGIGRPSSAPLKDEEWENYVRERKLLQPPSGVTPPIPTTDLPRRTPSPRVAMSPAVQAALAQRAHRESVLDVEPQTSGAAPMISPVPRSYHAAKRSSSYIPPTILPPTRSPGPSQPSPNSPGPRTVTYEELSQRHREKMRELQAPLTTQEKDRADVAAARARWERSRQVEKQDVERRLAERAQHVHSRSGDAVEDRDRRPSRHSRSLSADKLAVIGGPSGHNKRASLMKVEDWQRYQSQADEVAPRRSGGPSPVPFPNERRNSHRMSSLPSPRDPPT